MEKSNWKPWCCIFWGENDKIYEVHFYVLECCLVQIGKNFGLVQMHKENNEEIEVIAETKTKPKKKTVKKTAKKKQAVKKKS